MTHKIEEKLKIAILYDTWGDAPEAVEAKPPAKRKKAHKTRRKEKEDREEIFDSLTKLGHAPFYQTLDGTPQCLQALAKCDADLVFNLTESFAGDDTKDFNIAPYLELLDIPYTERGRMLVYWPKTKLWPRNCSPSTEFAAHFSPRHTAEKSITPRSVIPADRQTAL